MAPEAVNVADCPEQITGLLTVMVGLATTVTLTEALPVQPELLVPETEYVVETEGLTV